MQDIISLSYFRVIRNNLKPSHILSEASDRWVGGCGGGGGEVKTRRGWAKGAGEGGGGAAEKFIPVEKTALPLIGAKAVNLG